MMFGLNWITIAVIAGLGILVGVQEMRVQSLKTEHSEYVMQAEKNARMAADQALAEQSRRQDVYDKEADHARKEKAEMEQTVARLADTADGLRVDVATFQQRARKNACAPIGSKGESGPSPADLLAGLYLGSVETNRQLASYATELRRAGSACERAADGAR